MLKKFIYKTVLFSAILFAALSYLQSVVDKGLRRSRYRELSVWNDIYQSRIDANVIILGSSRAVAHFSPFILDSILGTKTYNFGMEAYDFKMQYARWRIYLQHNPPPKYVIASIDIFSLYKREFLYDYQQFLPYLTDTIVREATKGYGGEFNFLWYYIPFYKYHADPELVSEGMNHFYEKEDFRQDTINKGYNPYPKVWNGDYDDYLRAHPGKDFQQIYGYEVQLFREFLEDAKQRGVKVVMVYSPEYYSVQAKYTNRRDVMNIYRYFSERYEVPLIDYSNDTLCNSTSNFFNSQHLNKKAAEVFSKELGNDMKQRGFW